MQISLILLIICASGVLTYVGVELFRRHSLERQWLDVPNERSSHERPTPRGAGIVVVPVCLLGYVLTVLLTGIHFSWGYFLGAILVAFVSWLDDLYSLAFGWRLSAHILAALLVIYSEGSWNLISLGNGFTFSLLWAAPFVTILWIVWVVNAYNFMDGIDGIAGVQGMAASAAWTAICVGMGNGTYLFSLIVFSAVAAFVFHNWHPAKVFIGDVGSAFLGFTFAAMPLMAAKEIPSKADLFPVASILILWPFVFDTALTLCRRLLRRELIWQAHREHLYQRLVIAGFSHSKVAMIYGIFAVATSSAALLVVSGSGNYNLVIMGIVLILSAFLVFIVSKAYNAGVRLANTPHGA
jgi:Fuc2NAc and GlcNAc transferase